MEVRIHESADAFREVAEPLYECDPVANTIELTALHAGALRDDALLMSVRDAGVLVGVALQNPPYPLACNGLPPECHLAVTAELARIGANLTGVRGRRELAMAFTEAWCAVTGCAGTVTMEERLYRLGTLRRPAGVSGRHRDATRSDRALLVDWVKCFLAETFSHHRDDAAGEWFVDNAEKVGDRFVLWEGDGTPVSMAMLRAPSTGVSRLGPVFTPRSLRGNGFGSAVTAAAATLARQNGVKDVVLFADLANPTSNAIYQRIGFDAVADSVRVQFASSPAG